MAEPKPYERSYSFRAFPDDEQNARQLGLLLDRQFDEVSNGEKDLAAVVSASRIDTVVTVPPDAEPSLDDGVLSVPQGQPGVDGVDGAPGASVYDTWLLENPGGTTDQFLEDMQATPTPALAAMLVQAEIAAASAVNSAGAAATSEGVAVTAAEAASASAAQAELAAEGLRNVEQGEPLTDGGSAVVTLDGIGDMIRMYDDGLDLVPGRSLTNRVYDAGAEAGYQDAEGGSVIETLDGQPLRKLYPDGQDFVPSTRFIGRLGIPADFPMTEEKGDQALALGSVSTDDPDLNNGVVVITLDDDPLMRLEPDGLDFIPSEKFKDRLPSAGGGGLTADGWATAPDGTFTAQAGQHGVLAVDRFEDRGDGVRVPVVLINSVTRKAIIISVYGQSNANVTRLGDDLLWGTPPLPYNAFMLDDMNAFGSATHRGGMMGWQGTAVQRGTRMINASEALRGTQDYASVAFARLTMWDGSIRRAGLIRSSAWGGNALIGSTETTGIWKGSTGLYTQSWHNWTGDIQQAHDLLTAEGYEVEAVYICFTHQEEDWQTPRAQYLSDFLGMKADREALIEAAWPGMKVHWFVDQASGSGLRTPKYMGGAWPDRMSIYDATLPANGGDNITMVMPRYWLTFGYTLGGALEDIHHSYRSRVWQGEMYGHAMRAIELGQDWRCPVMTSATVSGNDVIVDFDSIEPLVIDPTFCKVRPDMGFVVGNGAVVSGVRLTGQRQVTVSCATAPATNISYAYRQQDGSDVADIWPISTGAIRDAWEAPSIFDPGKKLVRAALGFQLTL